uniref:Uncharacterized protein n=1 Tax=viral metagenome TaxID=1070528 RepID=A0A6M3L0C5_9ZZZZ
MIEIPSSQNADSRTAIEKVSKEVLLANSRQHIRDVKEAMNWMAWKLREISISHDWTKVTHIDEFHDDFSASQNGFQGDFKEQHWFKDLHLQERHHLLDRCPEDVNLFDVLEKIADCVMAGMARSGSVYDDTLSPELLEKAYQNTVELLKKETIVK